MVWTNLKLETFFYKIVFVDVSSWTTNMADNNNLRKELMDEIVGRKRMGDKKFHSESSLHQAFGEEDPTRSSSDEPDPGVSKAFVLMILIRLFFQIFIKITT